MDSLLDPYCESDEAYYEFVPANEQEIRHNYNSYMKRCPEADDTFEQYALDSGYSQENGCWGYYCNPNAKWDWWQIGGRWSSMLRTKDDGESCDSAKAPDVDFSEDPELAAEAERFWENFVEEKDPSAEFSIFNKHYYLERYSTKADYVKACAEFSAHAFVTPEGEWFEEGQMGWFAVDDATPATIRAFNDNLKIMIERAIAEDLWVTVVDCHI